MKKVTVVCVLVVVLACMWSSVALAWDADVDDAPESLRNYPFRILLKPPSGPQGYYQMLASSDHFYITSNGYYATDGNWCYAHYGTGSWTVSITNGSGVTNLDITESQIIEVGPDTIVYTDETKTETLYVGEMSRYIQIGTIPHMLRPYDAILVDTNWIYMRITVLEAGTQVYQEQGLTESYSEPFSDGRRNISIANMGLQDGHTYTFRVQGSDDGETWLNTSHPYVMEVTFSFFQSEADEVRVMGIEDEKTYAYAPMVSWRKAGKYRNAVLRVYLNSQIIYESPNASGYVNLAYLSEEDKGWLNIGEGIWNNHLTITVEQPGDDDYVVGTWDFWVKNDIMDMWNDNENMALPGVIEWDSDESVIQQIKNLGQEAIQVVKVSFDFIPPDVMVLIILAFTLVIALRVLGR